MQRFDQTKRCRMHCKIAPVVGSSSSAIFGLLSSSAAMLSRLFSPPDSPRVKASPIRLCATCVKV